MKRSDSSSSEDEVFNVLKEVVSTNNKALAQVFGDVFLRQLNNQSYAESLHSNLVHQEGPVFKGYPSGNFLKHLSKVLWLWAQAGYFPVSFSPVHGFETESTNKELDSLSQFTSIVLDFVSRVSEANAVSLGESVLLSLGVRGVLTCLGIRRTQGSVNSYLPPTREALVRAFKQRHTKEESKNSTLTVGARALTKHYHRSSEGFWGKSKGSEDERNALAENILERLLNECVWINVHCLPSEEPVVEVRVSEGYGARWFIKKQNGFRGFLEPMMEGGHDRGWRH